MKILNFLVGLVRAINQLADEKADDWTAELVCYDDYDESFWDAFPLFLTSLIAGALFLIIIGGYVSIATYFLFGQVIPTYEHILKMSSLDRCVFSVTAPLSLPSAMLSFHYARHAVWRLFN